MSELRHHHTERLRLDAPTMDDLDALYAIYSDPRVWTHFPILRHTNAERTRSLLDGWIRAWEQDGLGQWIVRSLDEDAVLGHAGCALRPAGWWNLGYRFAAEAHGQGLATEAGRAGVEAAAAVGPESPVVAYLLEHNVASRKVAEKLGLTLQHRAPDAGNPDPDAVRLVYADRPLTEEQLASTLGQPDSARRRFSDIRRVRLDESTADMLDDLRGDR